MIGNWTASSERDTEEKNRFTGDARKVTASSVIHRLLHCISKLVIPLPTSPPAFYCGPYTLAMKDMLYLPLTAISITEEGK